MKVLLHICCGICAIPAAERLMCEGHRVTGFFYNPNIHPQDEYAKRLEAARQVSRELSFELVEGPYNREKWFEMVKGKEYEPEGGIRCEACFRMRLEKTYEYLKKNMFDSFATTLAASPMKDAKLISDIGRAIGGDRFMAVDFRKKGGSQRAAELSQEWNLYRQNYCGCIYSLEDKLRKNKKQKDK